MKTTSPINSIVLAAMLISSSVARSATQQIALEAGWNLISLQVDVGSMDVREFVSHIDDSDSFQAIWDYVPETGKWRCCLPEHPEIPSDLDSVVPGRGYWVKVYNACVLTVEGEPWDGAISLRPGWNLIGFPGLVDTDIAAVFHNAIDNVQQIWEFSGGYLGKFSGYDVSAVPKCRDIVSLSPGKGYWVYAMDSFVLAAEPEILLTGDFDLPPLQELVRYQGADPTYQGRDIKFSGKEDMSTDLNRNGILDDAWTQDTMTYDSGVYRLPVILRNASNCGSLNWSIKEDCNWLSVEGSSSGTLAAGQRYVYLVVDKSELPAGVYSNSTLKVKAGNIEKRINVIMHVAAVAGDFSGYASATKVNGKNIPLGKVDMGLSVFMQSDGEDETRFKAVVDRTKSLLFPRDVFMNGVFYFDNNFSMTTSFTMPAGDRNAPPYDAFRHVDKTIDLSEVEDKDYNANGILDNDNPFPYPVRRSITLLGERLNENILFGSYIETMAGMLPNEEKVCVEGTFSLERQTFKPSQNSICAYRNAEAELIGMSNVSGIERIISVKEAVNVLSIKSIVSLDPYNIPLSALRITLTSPSGTMLVIHDGDAELNTVVETDEFNGENGKGDWKLNVSWGDTHGERGWFYSWDLSLGGVARYSVEGRLVDEDGNAVAGATVTLSGNNEIGGRTTDANGHFEFSDLTEDDYAVAYSRPGYEGSSSAFAIDDANVSLGNLRIPSVGGVGMSGIVAVPSVAVAPADVAFTVGYQVSEDEQVSSISWEAVHIDATGHVCRVSTEKTVARPNEKSWTIWQNFDENVYAYEIKAIVETSKCSVTNAYGPVGLSHTGLSESSDGARPIDAYLSNCGFIGSGSWPGNGFDATQDVREYEQMKRDCAAFDIDRYPFSAKMLFDGSGAISSEKEDTDFFIQDGTPYSRIATQKEKEQSNDNVYRPHVQPTTGVKRYRIITTMGAFVFGEQPARANGMVLQCGRIED